MVLTRLLPGLDWSDVERCSAECSDLLKSWPPRRSPASNGEVGIAPKSVVKGERSSRVPVLEASRAALGMHQVRELLDRCSARARMVVGGGRG